jgi:hypothetical protein
MHIARDVFDVGTPFTSTGSVGLNQTSLQHASGQRKNFVSVGEGRPSFFQLEPVTLLPEVNFSVGHVPPRVHSLNDQAVPAFLARRALTSASTSALQTRELLSFRPPMAAFREASGMALK